MKYGSPDFARALPIRSMIWLDVSRPIRVPSLQLLVVASFAALLTRRAKKVFAKLFFATTFAACVMMAVPCSASRAFEKLCTLVFSPRAYPNETTMDSGSPSFSMASRKWAMIKTRGKPRRSRRGRIALFSLSLGPQRIK